MYTLFSFSIFCDLISKRSEKCGQLLQYFKIAEPAQGL